MTNLPFVALIVVGFVATFGGCASPRRSAYEARVVGTDVIHFYAALDAAGQDADARVTAGALDRHYFSVGTPGLASFTSARIGSADAMAMVVSARREYYDWIRPGLLAMASDATVQDRVREAFVRLNEWLPEARFGDTYLVVGRMNSAGTVGRAGLLIGLEMFGRSPDVPTGSLDRWAEMTIREPEDLVFTIVHESIHPLQVGRPPRTLLEAAINEGACDFMASLATGTTRRTPTYEYARAHEATLWREFSRDMHGKDWGDWLYATPTDATRPPDLAYAIGAFICEAYWEKASDKQAAMRALLEVRNAPAVLRASGYSPE